MLLCTFARALVLQHVPARLKNGRLISTGMKGEYDVFLNLIGMKNANW